MRDISELTCWIIQSGIMEEMMEETLDSVDDDELEEEADAEVDKILFELTDGKLGQAGKVGGELPVSHRRAVFIFPFLNLSQLHPHDRIRQNNPGTAMLINLLGYKGGRRGKRTGDAENAEGNAGSIEWMSGSLLGVRLE